MNFAATESAILIMVTLLAREAISLVAGYFFKKVTASDDYVTKKDFAAFAKRAEGYITKADCEKCSKSGDATLDRLTEDLSVVKKILLVMASKQGVPPEDLKSLIH
ncbi:MAG TPA: hypothetical protein DCP69_03405 [Candidatus Omnitrophica bacterium]|nr:hypothetical protein [Candidatus Omnitrophota bacterium]